MVLFLFDMHLCVMYTLRNSNIVLFFYYFLSVSDNVYLIYFSFNFPTLFSAIKLVRLETKTPETKKSCNCMVSNDL